MNRRDFLAAGIGAIPGLAGGVSITADPADPVAAAAPVQWALGELSNAVKGDRAIVVAGPKSAKVALPSAPESFSIVPGKTVQVAGSDVRGLVYGILELADRGGEVRTTVVEKPANAVRSVARCFVSDVEDKAWFYDRDMWRAYLTMLAAERFNRFNLTLGIGYNSNRQIPDSYFYFAYPFLLPVRGYDVRAVGLADEERDRNLATLKFIGEETASRGLQFNLALWSHAYQWPDPTNDHIAGLTPETHAPYSRDALAALLDACPSITGLSFRLHGESGVPDGSYEFWQTLFEAIKHCGRRIDLDLHAKMTDQRHIDIALATGMPVSMAPKYWAEHLGMPYHQADIRAQERPKNEKSRSFLRYGYGDYLKEGRNFGIIHRIWPGTQRHLLWGDPLMAAAYGRAFSFCGSLGVEMCEPLSFKGRIGSGKPGGRCAYADKSLETKYDWEKFRYQYRVWGRLIYNPQTDPEGWRRYLRREFGAAARPAEEALASASRILPIVTTAHGASGSNNTYWPEMYTNMPIVDAKRPHPYRDTAEPRRFGTVSAFDPQLFASIEEFASGERVKYSPLEVARWLEDLANTAAKNLAKAEAAAPKTAEFRRWSADVSIQAGLGLFFAFKFRSAVWWALGNREEALKAYRAARQAWARMAEGPASVYAADITYGPSPNLRGHWKDRLAEIDADIADMEVGQVPDLPSQSHALPNQRARPSSQPRHTPDKRFRPGDPLSVAVSFDKPGERKVRLLYRHVNQAERWRADEMPPRGSEFVAMIPAEYTRSPYPLQYYFEVHEGGAARIYPGFGPDLCKQPYFVVRQTLTPVS